MSYKTMIQSQVDKAFKAIGDLAEDVVLQKKTANSFNFSTGNVSITEAPNLSTKAVVTAHDKKSESHNVIKKLIMLKTHEVGDLNAYDKSIIKGQEWKIGPIIQSDGYITTAEIFREV